MNNKPQTTNIKHQTPDKLWLITASCAARPARLGTSVAALPRFHPPDRPAPTALGQKGTRTRPKPGSDFISIIYSFSSS